MVSFVDIKERNPAGRSVETAPCCDASTSVASSERTNREGMRLDEIGWLSLIIGLESPCSHTLGGGQKHVLKHFDTFCIFCCLRFEVCHFLVILRPTYSSVYSGIARFRNALSFGFSQTSPVDSFGLWTEGLRFSCCKD